MEWSDVEKTVEAFSKLDGLVFFVELGEPTENLSSYETLGAVNWHVRYGFGDAENTDGYLRTAEDLNWFLEIGIPALMKTFYEPNIN